MHCQKFLTFVSAGILAPQSTVENVNEPTLGNVLKFESEAGSQDIVGALTLSFTVNSSSFSRFNVSFPFCPRSAPWYTSAQHFVMLNKPSSSRPFLHHSFPFPRLSQQPCRAPGSVQISYFFLLTRFVYNSPDEIFSVLNKSSSALQTYQNSGKANKSKPKSHSFPYVYLFSC